MFLLNGLLILTCFADTTFRPVNTQAAFDSLANGANYTYNGATGSTARYFADQGAPEMHFDVVGPYTLPHKSVYYATRNPDCGQEQYIADYVMDACHLADSAGVDFRDYDEDGDSIIDFVYLIFQGHGTNDSYDYSTIWPHEWDIESALAYSLTAQDSVYVDYDWDTDSILDEKLPHYDGMQLGLYACSPEVRNRDKMRTGIGTMAHEFSHVLGLPDYYVGDTGNKSVGKWSIMGTGCYNNNGNTPPNWSIYDKCYVGWDSVAGMDPRSKDTLYWHETRADSAWDHYLDSHGEMTWRVIYDSAKWAVDSVNGGVQRMVHMVGRVTPVEEVRSAPKPSGKKYMRDGKVFIREEENAYDLTGRKR